MKTELTRRSFLHHAGTLGLIAGQFARHAPDAANAAAPEAARPGAKDTFALIGQGKKIPVVFDTDIGGDIDDTWALVVLLKSPEFDVKLITSDSGNDTYRAKIIAKMLEVCGRTEIPVGIGCHPGDNPGRQSRWVGDYDLSRFPGTVHQDGVAAIIDTIDKAADPVSLVAVGPVPNIGEALRRAPRIADKARFIGMHGSVRRGYGNSPEIAAEYNVRACPQGLQQVFAAGWDVTVTPLDTCGIIRLEGEKFQKVYRSQDPALKALMANYQAWRESEDPDKGPLGPPQRSSTLFDTVAVYLAYSQQLCQMETLGLRVTDDGFTRIDEAARKVHCAMKWKDLGAFEDELVGRLLRAG
jgi:inosine-uridine nucleoside N-ribohydrolase